MQLRPFEAGFYDNESIVVRNPDNGKQELFSVPEFEILKFLKQNEQETLLALLLPNIGIAKKDHILLCLTVIRKLRRLEIADHVDITGKQPTGTNSLTGEVEVTRHKLEFSAFRSLATALLVVGDALLGWAGSFLILFGVFVLAAVSFAFFPFESVEPALHAHQGIVYWKLFPVMYGTATAAFWLRAFLQSAFLKALGRKGRVGWFGFYFPFLSLDLDRSPVNLAGRSYRMQMALVGMLAPLALSAPFAALTLLGKIPVDAGFYGFAACVLVTLITACPFLDFDMADLLHLMTDREALVGKVAYRMRHWFLNRKALDRPILLTAFFSFLWLLAWLDSLHSFFELVYPQFSEDIYFYEDIPRAGGGGALAVAMILLVLMPVGTFFVAFVRDLLQARRARLVVAKGKVQESLSPEEKLAALRNIPLFAYLDESHRQALLAEMSPAYFAAGEALVRQGEVGKDFFVMAKGKAAVSFRDAQKNEYFLAGIGEGDAFGEIALIDDVPRTATIRSDGGCIALVLNKDSFDRFALSLGAPDRVKTMIRLTSFFRRHPLFSRLGAKDLAELIDRVAFEAVTAGEVIPGAGESFRVVYSGQVQVDTDSDLPNPALGADDCFGYSNALGARFVASDGTGLLTLTYQDFHALIWEKLVERPELFL